MRWFGSGCVWLEGVVVLGHVQPRTMFESALAALPQFILDTQADWTMVRDWMEDQCGSLTDAQWDEVDEVFAEFEEFDPTAS